MICREIYIKVNIRAVYCPKTLIVQRASAKCRPKRNVDILKLRPELQVTPRPDVICSVLFHKADQLTEMFRLVLSHVCFNPFRHLKSCRRIVKISRSH